MHLWLLLVACSPSEAEQMLAAHSAPTLEEALAACPEGSGECQHDAVVRFEAWARCSDLPDPWGDECRFQQAEGMEHADDGPGAFALCATIRYSVGCGTHVAGQQSRRPADLTEAEARWTTLGGHAEPRFAFPYWQGFWRNRIDHGDAPPLEACRSRVCRDAGRKHIEATVASLAVPCTALDRPPPAWVPEGSAESREVWTTALSRHCVADAAQPVPTR